MKNPTQPFNVAGAVSLVSPNRARQISAACARLVDLLARPGNPYDRLDVTDLPTDGCGAEDGDEVGGRNEAYYYDAAEPYRADATWKPLDCI